ncbi:hypothetical protein GCM10020227_58090 [Streptomyces flavovirens]
MLSMLPSCADGVCEVGVGQCVGADLGEDGVGGGVGEAQGEGVGRVGDLEAAEQRAGVGLVALRREAAGGQGADRVADGGLAFGADVDALVGGGAGGEGVGWSRI